MHYVWVMLKKDLRELWKDRPELVSLFLVPLAFIIPICFALGGGDGYGVRAGNNKIYVPVANYDGGPRAADLIKTLQDSFNIENNLSLEKAAEAGVAENPACAAPGPACDEVILTAWLVKSNADAGLIIPAGFSQAVDTGQEVALILRYDPAGDGARRQQIEGVVRGAAVRQALNRAGQNAGEQFKLMTQYAPKELKDKIQSTDFQGGSQNDPAIRFEKTRPPGFEDLPTPNTYQQTVPGYTVMFIFFLIGTLTSSVRAEKASGTLRRLLNTPAPRYALLTGKLGCAFLTGCIQTVVMFLAAWIIFGFVPGRNLAALALVTVALALTAACIGLAVSTFKIGSGVLSAPLIISALLGGCMFPIDLMPPFLRTLSLFVPHSWALTAFQDVMVRGGGIVDVLPEVGVLLLFSAAFFAFGVYRFDFEE